MYGSSSTLYLPALLELEKPSQCINGDGNSSLARHNPLHQRGATSETWPFMTSKTLRSGVSPSRL